LMTTGGPASISAAYAPDSIILDGCTGYLDYATSSSECQFAYSQSRSA
jgi:hypothetical protein